MCFIAMAFVYSGEFFCSPLLVSELVYVQSVDTVPTFLLHPYPSLQEKGRGVPKETETVHS